MGAFSFRFYKRYRYEDPRGYHDLFLSDLEAWLRSRGYRTSREETIMYLHKDRKNDAIRSIRGLIDLCAKNKEHKVAVEFDNGKRLKLKSIEKMANSAADVLVGVIVGGDENKILGNNYQRYSELAISNPSVSRDIWLIILSETRIEQLSLPKNAPLSSKSLGTTKADGVRAQALIGEKEHLQRTIEDY